MAIDRARRHQPSDDGVLESRGRAPEARGRRRRAAAGALHVTDQVRGRRDTVGGSVIRAHSTAASTSGDIGSRSTATRPTLCSTAGSVSGTARTSEIGPITSRSVPSPRPPTSRMPPVPADGRPARAVTLHVHGCRSHAFDRFVVEVRFCVTASLKASARGTNCQVRQCQGLVAVAPPAAGRGRLCATVRATRLTPRYRPRVLDMRPPARRTSITMSHSGRL